MELEVTGHMAYVEGISARQSTSWSRPMGIRGTSKSQVSRLCEEIDVKVKTFLARRLRAIGRTCGSTRPT